MGGCQEEVMFQFRRLLLAKTLYISTSAHGPSSPIFAIKSNAKGDITPGQAGIPNEYVKWSIPRGGSIFIQLLLFRAHLIYKLEMALLSASRQKQGNSLNTAKLGILKVL